MIEGPTTFGEALRDIQRQIDAIRAKILFVIGNGFLRRALQLYQASGRQHIVDAIIDSLEDGAAERREEVRRREALDRAPKSLEDRCGAEPEAETHQVGRWPRDCQKCHDHIAERNR